MDFQVLKLVYRKSRTFWGQNGLRSHILTHEEITVYNFRRLWGLFGKPPIDSLSARIFPTVYFTVGGRSEFLLTWVLLGPQTALRFESNNLSTVITSLWGRPFSGVFVDKLHIGTLLRWRLLKQTSAIHH